MKDETLQRLVSSIDLVELVRGVVVLNHSLNGPCPKCGGRDRFFITRPRTHFGCRKCDFRGDALDFVVGAYNLSIPEAVSFLGGKTSVPDRPRLQPVQDLPSGDWRRSSWQEKIKLKIDSAHNLIKRLPNHGSDYLSARGISEEMIELYRLGYDTRVYDPVDQSHRPAITIPWLLKGGTVTALKYRYIDMAASVDKSRRFRQESGGEMVIYGLHTRICADNLAIIEGEFNAISVRQSAGTFCDVMSAGGDFNLMGFARLAVLAKDYERVFIWLDAEDKLARVVALLNHPNVTATTTGIKLGKLGRQTADANDILARADAKRLGIVIRSKFSSEP